MTQKTSGRHVYSRLLAESEPLSQNEEEQLFDIYFNHKNEGMCKKVREKILLSHQRFVCFIATRYAKSTKGVDLDDLLAEGNLGLLDAIKRFDPSRGTHFSAYAKGWIRFYVFNYVRSHIQSGRVDQSRASRKLFLRYAKELRRIEQEVADEFKESPSYHKGEIYERLARRLGTSVEAIHRYHSVRSNERINTIGLTNDEFHDGIEIGVTDDKSDSIDQKKLIPMLSEKYESLSPREKDILARRFGFGKDPGFETESFGAIAKQYALSSQRIGKIERKAIEKLRTSLETMLKPGDKG